MDGLKTIVPLAIDFIVFPFKLIYASIRLTMDIISGIIDFVKKIGVFSAVGNVIGKVVGLVKKPFE
jgi:hypothetical protein